MEKILKAKVSNYYLYLGDTENKKLYKSYVYLNTGDYSFNTHQEADWLNIQEATPKEIEYYNHIKETRKSIPFSDFISKKKVYEIY